MKPRRILSSEDWVTGVAPWGGLSQLGVRQVQATPRKPVYHKVLAQRTIGRDVRVGKFLRGAVPQFLP